MKKMMRTVSVLALFLGLTTVQLKVAEAQSTTALTVCQYNWSAPASGWRSRPWQPWNCSNGTPPAGAWAVGQAQNGRGTSGEADCYTNVGEHYNHPTVDGSTSATLGCAFVAPPPAPQPSPAITICKHTFTEAVTGLRTWPWQITDCSNGLPEPGSFAVGQGTNGNGTSGQVTCSETQGTHYNHPIINGATSGSVTCLFVSPTQVDDPEATVCSYTWSDSATGLRTHPWVDQDCSHGLPDPTAIGVGQGQNGDGIQGTQGQVTCSLTAGSHFNDLNHDGSTTGTVRCLYVRTPPPPSGNGYSYDLNSDGVNDANLTVAPCTGDATRYCLRVNSWLFSPAQREIQLHSEARPIGSGQTRNYAISNTTAYRYYRLNVTANNGFASYLVIREIGLYGPDLTPAMTSPTTPAPNAVVSSSNWSAEQREFCAFDKDLQTPDYKNEWVTANGTTAAWIYYDFGVGNTKLVTRYAITATGLYSPTSAPKSWTFEGSSDAVTWTVLDTRSNEINWTTVPSSVVTYQPPLVLIGDHTGDGLVEASLLYTRERFAPGAYYSPALAVIDIDLLSILGDGAAPAGRTGLASFTFYPRGPGGLRHPALTPSYGDDSSANNWGYGCLWKPGSSSTECGTNMVKIDTAGAPPPNYWFREVGGYLQDLDGDGWDDLNLIYHTYQKAISSRTGQALTVPATSYDVAAQGGDPSLPVGFHSGRNYGTHSAITGTDGKLRTIMAGAGNVGRFDDVMCNVSRFLGALEATFPNPNSRVLRWASYQSFHSNNWTSLPPVPWGQPAPTPSRWGNFADHCIHTFHDSTTTTVVRGVPVPAMVYNYFSADYSPTGINAALSSRCKDEQYQLYVDNPPWSQRSQDAWYACNARHLSAKGFWGMQVIRQDNGLNITGSQNSYIWGWSNLLKPGGEILYLVENMPNPVRFDNKQDDGVTPIPAPPMTINAIVEGLWQGNGVFPVAGRPVLSYFGNSGMDSFGQGSYTSFVKLTLEDRDLDGYMEVLIQKPDTTRVWVGWSAAKSTWVVKP